LSGGTRSPRSASAAVRDHGLRRLATACCRSTTATPENHRRAISLSEAHLQAARRDARRTLGREAEGVLHRFWSIGNRGPASARSAFRVLAAGDRDVDAALAFRRGLLAAAEVADAAPATALTPEGPSCARLRRCPDCREQQQAAPLAKPKSWLLGMKTGSAPGASGRRTRRSWRAIGRCLQTTSQPANVSWCFHAKAQATSVEP
jgi:hypothetical protein